MTCPFQWDLPLSLPSPRAGASKASSGGSLASCRWKMLILEKETIRPSPGLNVPAAEAANWPRVCRLLANLTKSVEPWCYLTEKGAG